MFSHIMIGTNDLERAKRFYDSVLGTLGVPPAQVDGHRIFYMTPAGVFSVSKPIDGQPATPRQRRHDRFRRQVARARRTPGTPPAWPPAGTSIEDPPGVREGGLGKMYLAYLRDPDGNKICALHRM